MFCLVRWLAYAKLCFSSYMVFCHIWQLGEGATCSSQAEVDRPVFLDIKHEPYNRLSFTCWCTLPNCNPIDRKSATTSQKKDQLWCLKMSVSKVWFYFYSHNSQTIGNIWVKQPTEGQYNFPSNYTQCNAIWSRWENGNQFCKEIYFQREPICSI